MNWWGRWKAKHWDARPLPAGVFAPHGGYPPLRAVAEWFAEHWRKQPLGLLTTIAVVVGTIAGIIRMLH